MPRHRDKSHPRKQHNQVSLRTVVAASIALIPLLNLLLIAVLETAMEYEIYLPKTLFIFLNASLIVLTAVTALFRRIIAVPGFLQWIEEYFPSPAHQRGDEPEEEE